MFDFLMIAHRSRKGEIEVYPKFIIGNTKDLMIRGRDFYAVWLESKGVWSVDEQDLIDEIDAELDAYADKLKQKFEDSKVRVMHMWDSESGMIDLWHKYCQKQMRDKYKDLDNELIFSNQTTVKSDYSSKKLPYPLEEGPTPAYDELMSVLYSPEERHKIEWGIGAVVTGQSKKIQKFLVFYGPPGSGKSTVLNIISMLFDGYSTEFDAEVLGSASNSFPLEQLKSNPLVGICHDTNLSKIEKNTLLNSLISHERMVVNEKHKPTYRLKFNTFCFIGSNDPVKITDAKSGMIRRLIDVNPTGNRISLRKYNELMKAVEFELGAIASKCKNVFLECPEYYEAYRPVNMMAETNDFFNFIEDNYFTFKKQDAVSLKQAWEMYKVYCEEAKVPYPFSMRVFRAELKNYFTEYSDRIRIGDEWVRSYYSGFKASMLDAVSLKSEVPDDVDTSNLISFEECESKLDEYCKECPAQYGNDSEVPYKKWSDVKTKLCDIDTRKLHYVKVPENLIVIDFDLKDETGEKSYERNLQEASKWPKTYAELSKSGKGIHLHYIYTGGDPSLLSRVYSDGIEIKVFTGNSSLRRKVTKCNNEPINTISSGLPKKEEGKMVNFQTVANEKALRTLIRKNLNKEYHGATKPSVDFIFEALENAYNSGMSYDVSDMHNAVLAFAASSTHQADACIKLVSKMHWKSENYSQPLDNDDQPLVIYDIEVFPNLFMLNWKKVGSKTVNHMINPTPEELRKLFKYRLIGFNNRRYDNHMVYAAAFLNYGLYELFLLSQRLIVKGEGFFSEAYNLSYTDIYDYAAKKQSLKKWEVELGIHHQELGLPWDKPVPEDKWSMVADYCDNDVNSEEAVWFATQGDFTARRILADLAGMTVNDTTNSLTTKIIFGNNKKPQLNYVDLSKEFPGYEFKKEWNEKTKTYDKYNMFRGVDLGFGGYVYAEPGMYGDVALLDVASLHPHSIIAMNLFGEYTVKFKMLVDIRVNIKHKQYDIVRHEFDGKLAKYLEDEGTAKELSSALKIAINSVYGLTSAKFDNPFRDPRNENNIVALRGALFMKSLQDEVASRGFKVIHIKTDSIKIPDATPEIINFCMEFGKKYGYTFEHEATYDRICLVNDSTYIAKYADGFGEGWTATGLQFQIPYVFKTCFSGEQIVSRDLCEVKEVKTAIHLDMNEGLVNDELENDLDMVISHRHVAEDVADPMTKKERIIFDSYVDYSDAELLEMKNKLHSYKFIGRVGLFCPILPGHGGGIMVREQKKPDGSIAMYSVTGTKGYRWLEAEEVIGTEKEAYIDRTYYDNLVTDAVNTINKFGDYEWFVSDDPYPKPLFMGGVPLYDEGNTNPCSPNYLRRTN